MYLCWLHAVLLLHAGILMRRLAANLAVPQEFYSTLSLWDDLVDPVFDGVGLAGFKSRANAFLFYSILLLGIIGRIYCIRQSINALSNLLMH